jgi:hypothetical protein
MVTLCIYFEHNKFYVNYFLNILCPYYKFIQAILLYFLKLFQMEKNTTIFLKHIWEISSGGLPYNTFKT